MEQQPTPIDTRLPDRAIIIDPMPPASQYRLFWSIAQIGRFLTKTLRLKFSGRLDEETSAAMTRQLFERLSGVWIKAGQLLSLRNDLISGAMARELSSLQFQARGFSPDVARTVIEEDLGRPISSVFSHFETEPFAAASIAQVHRATLLDNNRAVVVKVMRPDVERSFNRDLRLLEWIVRLINLVGLLKRFNMRAGVDELRAILQEETNYEYEAVNLRRMRKNLRKHNIYVPRVMMALCRRRVLVMEDIPGVLMSRYLDLRREDPDRAYRWAVTNGIDDKTLARRLSTTLLRQILEDNEFHGDLHPGNIMLLADNQIALIDFGSVGRLNRQIWTLYRYALAAMAMRDYARAADMMLMMSPSISSANTRRLRREMTETLTEWELFSQFTGGSYADRSLASMSNRVSQVMAKNNVPLNWAIMRVGRSLSTLDASLQSLVPEESFISLCRAYFRDRERRARTAQGRRAELRSALMKFIGLAEDTSLLVGTGIREQALRLHGMLDTLTRVRLIFLTFLQRALEIWILLLCQAFVIDFLLRGLVNEERWIHLPVFHYLAAAVPGMHPIYWGLAIAFTIWLLRMVRSLRHTITRLQ